MATITIPLPSWASFDRWLTRFEDENVTDLSGVGASVPSPDRRSIILWNFRKNTALDKYLNAGFSHVWSNLKAELLTNNPNNKTINDAYMASSAQLSGDWSWEPTDANYYGNRYEQAKNEVRAIADGVVLSANTFVTCELGEGSKKFPDVYWVIYHFRNRYLERLGNPPVQTTEVYTEYGNQAVNITTDWMIDYNAPYETKWQPLDATWIDPTASQNAARTGHSGNFNAYFNQPIDSGRKLFDVCNGVLNMYLSFDRYGRDIGSTFHYNVEQFRRACGAATPRKLCVVTWNTQQSNNSFVDQLGRADWIIPQQGGYVVMQPSIPLTDPELHYKIFLLALIRCDSVLDWDDKGSYITDPTQIKLAPINPDTGQPAYEDPYFVSEGGSFTILPRSFAGDVYPRNPLVSRDCLVAAISVFAQIKSYVFNAPDGGHYCVYRIVGGTTYTGCTGKMSAYGAPVYGVTAPNLMAFYNTGIAMRWVWNNKLLVVYHNEYLPYAIDAEGSDPAAPGQETLEFQYNNVWYGPVTVPAGAIRCFLFDIDIS